MAKTTVTYYCQECGCAYPKWSGKCEGCNSWNTLVAETVEKGREKSGTCLTLQPLHTKGYEENDLRSPTAFQEFDRVLGGGLVSGAAILLGGDPGMGKSTLLLQVVGKLAYASLCYYFSGEESFKQVQLRAKRLGLIDSPLHMAASSRLEDIIQTIQKAKDLKVVVIDSIQTISSEFLDASPGSVSQVKYCAYELIQLAKSLNFSLLLVGHVTKDGAIAGPRVLEHMVDTVLHFEGERHYDFRILRAIKNRFGASNEIGVFRMQGQGLEEVSNPSKLFLSDHHEGMIGSAVFAGMEGTRPVLCDVQALVAPSFLAAPRRTTVGWDSNRLSMILAVLEARYGYKFGKKDVYVTVAGGLKIAEPAIDLAVAAAVISADKNQPLPPQTVYFGELSLNGDIRSTFFEDLRIKEAKRLGFEKIMCTPKDKNVEGVIKANIRTVLT